MFDKLLEIDVEGSFHLLNLCIAYAVENLKFIFAVFLKCLCCFKQSGKVFILSLKTSTSYILVFRQVFQNICLYG